VTPGVVLEPVSTTDVVAHVNGGCAAILTFGGVVFEVTLTVEVAVQPLTETVSV
jgi:hypothetical protein